MYKVASDKKQSALHRGRPTDWVNGEERPKTAEDQYKALVDEVRIIQGRLKECPQHPERKELIAQQMRVQEKITAIRPLVSRQKFAYRDLAEFFVDIAKEQLPRAQFKAMYEAARRTKEQASLPAGQSVAQTENKTGE